jgi:molybdopterin-guanine dinucleotide biosynthesis protein A
VDHCAGHDVSLTGPERQKNLKQKQISMGKIRSIPKVSCAILAGGRSKRMGTDKSFLDVAGRPLFEWTLESLEGLGEELFIVTNSPDKYSEWSVPAVADIVPGYGTLGGLYTALSHARYERVIVVACDMPFLSRPLLRYQLLLSRDFDVVVPRMSEWLEPLHTVYASVCMEIVKRLMDRGERRLQRLFPLVNVRYVDPPELDMFDPERRSFMNVNTPADLEAVRRLAIEEAPNRRRRDTA